MKSVKNISENVHWSLQIARNFLTIVELFENPSHGNPCHGVMDGLTSSWL
jgi:hypothetical protein